MNTTSYVGILLLPCGAPEDRDGGICESPLPYPLDSNSSTRGIAAAGYWAAAGLCPFRQLNSGAIARRHFDVRIECFVFDPGSFAFQLVLFGLYLSFFIIGWKKDAVCVALTHVFWITADRDYCANFVGCKSISPNRLGRTIL